MAAVLCVDACLAAKWVVWEPDSDRALDLLAQWESDDVLWIAPAFFFAEMGTIFRKQAARGLVDNLAARDSFEEALRIRVTLAPVPWLRAYDIAASLRHLHVYDACYLAVAESVNAEFWTADVPLHARAASLFPWVHLL